MPRPTEPHDPTSDELASTAEAVDLGPGPWRSAFAVWIPGRVRSKSNYRHDKKTAWSELTGYDETVYLTARQHLPATWAQPVDNSLPASLRGLGNLPALETETEATHPVVVHLTARTLLDTGNVSKSVLDALEGLLYANDAQVAAASEHVVRARTDQGLLASFAQLEADADYWAAADAHVALQLAVNAALRKLLPSPASTHCTAPSHAHPAAGPDDAPSNASCQRADHPTTPAHPASAHPTLTATDATNEELIRA